MALFTLLSKTPSSHRRRPLKRHAHKGDVSTNSKDLKRDREIFPLANTRSYDERGAAVSTLAGR